MDRGTLKTILADARAEGVSCHLLVQRAPGEAERDGWSREARYSAVGLGVYGLAMPSEGPTVKVYVSLPHARATGGSAKVWEHACWAALHELGHLTPRNRTLVSRGAKERHAWRAAFAYATERGYGQPDREALDFANRCLRSYGAPELALSAIRPIDDRGTVTA